MNRKSIRSLIGQVAEKSAELDFDGGVGASGALALLCPLLTARPVEFNVPVDVPIAQD